jgi:hypothetical protein
MMFHEPRFGLIVSICALALVLTGCASGAPAGRFEANPYGCDQLVDELRGMGLRVVVTAEDGSALINPNVAVRTIEIGDDSLGDVEVQVFEYPDEETRKADSVAIAPSGSPIGERYVTWLDQPNFWAAGELIVLYVGRDREVLELLSTVLGEPVTEHSPGTP